MGSRPVKKGGPTRVRLGAWRCQGTLGQHGGQGDHAAEANLKQALHPSLRSSKKRVNLKKLPQKLQWKLHQLKIL